MGYIRQLIFKCKNKDCLELFYTKINLLTQIEYVSKALILECVNQGKYDYIDSSYDFSVLLFFSDINDIEMYVSHPNHINFVKNILKEVDVTVFDYSVNEGQVNLIT